jgi:hypothetical protein
VLIVHKSGNSEVRDVLIGAVTAQFLEKDRDVVGLAVRAEVLAAFISRREDEPLLKRVERGKRGGWKEGNGGRVLGVFVSVENEGHFDEETSLPFVKHGFSRRRFEGQLLDEP